MTASINFVTRYLVYKHFYRLRCRIPMIRGFVKVTKSAW